MPRKIKAPQNLDVKAVIQLAWAAQRPVPHTPAFLHLAVAALLARIERRNPAEAQMLRYQLQVLRLIELQDLTVLEKLFAEHPRGGELEKEINQAFNLAMSGLIFGKVGRGKHHIPILRLQRKLLIQYLENHPCPNEPFRLRGKWVDEHGGLIGQLLSLFKCLCSYPESLVGVYLNDRRRTTPGRVIELLLAELHSSTPDHIHKLLSHYRPKSIK